MKNSVRRALLSVSDKTGIVEFARELKERGIELLSTGGTAKLLVHHGIAVKEVADHTGFPEIMGGRVKTLHPKIHGGLLGRRGVDEDVMREHGIEPIDLLAVNLYPFAETVARADCTYDEAVDNIDIGGPAMVRAAAKNHASVTVVVDPQDYRGILDELAANQGSTRVIVRQTLAAKAFAHTAQYDAMVSAYFTGAIGGATDRFPDDLNLSFRKHLDLRYGENPHQQAAFYRDPRGIGASITSAAQLQGKELSYNNITDSDTALECVRQFDAPACVIVKHANPCGAAASAEGIAAAYASAYRTDPTSAFGGIIAFNRELDAATAAAIVARQFVEVIIAPRIAPGAHEVLAAKDNVRVLETGDLSRPVSQLLEYKSVAGGLLVQTRDDAMIGPRGFARRDEAPTHRRRDRRSAVRVARREIREIERHRLREGPGYRWHRRRPDEPRGEHQDRGHEGQGRGLAARFRGAGLRCVLSVPRRARRRRGIRHQVRDSAGRLGARRGGHRRGRRAQMAMVFTGMRHFRH